MKGDLIHYFFGKWEFEREIIFSETKEHYAKARGEAEFDFILSTANELKYEEKGKVILGNAIQHTTFFRYYRYVFSQDGLDIYFQDELTQNFNIYQSYSYEKEAHSLIAIDKHLCNKDIYEGRFRLHNENHFVHTTLIKGPNKDYFITTHFERLR